MRYRNGVLKGRLWQKQVRDKDMYAQKNHLLVSSWYSLIVRLRFSPVNTFDDVDAVAGRADLLVELVLAIELSCICGRCNDEKDCLLGGSVKLLFVVGIEPEKLALLPEAPVRSDVFRSRTVFISLRKAAIFSGGMPIDDTPTFRTGTMGFSTGVGACLRDARADAKRLCGSASDEIEIRFFLGKGKGGGGGGGGGGGPPEYEVGLLNSCDIKFSLFMYKEHSRHMYLFL